MRKLSLYANRIGAGDFDQTISIQNQDEIFGDRRIDKCRAQLEAFHVGYQVAFRYPGDFRGRFLFDLSECDGAARIEYKFEQFIAVVAKPPPVRFAIMDNVARHAIGAKMVAQVLGGFQLELDDVRVVQCAISFSG